MRLFIGTPAARLHPICWARLLWRGDFAPVSGLRSDDRVRPVRPCQASFLPDRIDGRARPPRVQPTSTAGSPAPGSASCRGVAPAYRNHPSAVCWRAGARGDDLEVHVSHAATTATRHRRSRLLRLVRDDHFGRQEQRGDRRGVLQRRAGDLGRVNDAGLDHVDVLAGGRIQAVPGLEVAHLLDHDATFEAGVHRDLLERGLQRQPNDVRAGRLVPDELKLLERGDRGVQQGDATAGDDALFDGRLRVRNGVLDPVLLLLELDLGGRADLDDGHAAGQLGEPLLQLLAVVVGIRLLDLGADLVDPTGDLVGVTRTLDDGRLVLGDDDLASPAEQVERRVVELEPDLLADDLTAGQDRDVGEHGLAPVTEARGLHRSGLEGPADLVDDQRCQRLTLDVLGDDRQRLTGLHDLLQQREQVLDRGDLGVDHEQVGVVEDGLHPLRVGDEVRRDVALVEAHALGELELQAEGIALLDGDDAFLADLVHRLGDHAADGLVAGRDRGGRSNLLLGLDVLGGLGQILADRLYGGLDALLQAHRVGAGGHVAQAFAHQRLGQDGGGGGAVTGDVVGLLRDFLDELGPDLLVRVLELDLLGDAHTVVGDGGSTPLLLQDDVAALRAERHPYRVSELVHARSSPRRASSSNAIIFAMWWSFLGTGDCRWPELGWRPRRMVWPAGEPVDRLTRSRSGTQHVRVLVRCLALDPGECKAKGAGGGPRLAWAPLPPRSPVGWSARIRHERFTSRPSRLRPHRPAAAYGPASPRRSSGPAPGWRRAMLRRRTALPVGAALLSAALAPMS